MASYSNRMTTPRPASRKGSRIGGRVGSRRRGVTSVLAMLYLIVFSALALGFYAQSSLSSQVSSNEKRLTESQAAAESGLQFMRYHLSALDIPGDTVKAKVLEQVYQQLAVRLEGFGSLYDPKTKTNQLLDFVPISPKPLAPQTPYKILVPGGNGYIRLSENGPGFRAVITESNRQLTVKVTGQAGGTTVAKAVEVKYDVTRHTSETLKYGIATRGTVTIDTGAKLLGVNSADGSIFSTATTNPALTVGNNSMVSGEVSFTQSNPTLSVSSTGGIFNTTVPSAWAPHVLKSQTAPEFPQINTEDYLQFCLKPDGTRNYYSGILPLDNTLKNVVLKANQVYNFGNQMNILGVLYLETPCTVNFSGGVNVTGVIVAQTPTTGLIADYPLNGLTPTDGIVKNLISIAGNCTFQGVDALPTNDPAFPQALRDMTGSQIIAPKFKLYCTGNFTSMGGSIAASQITFDGSSSGTIKGSLINLENKPVLLSGKTITIDHTVLNKFPAGIYFGHHYSPKPGSYMEVNPWN
jgi:hypothetical protein